MNNKIDLHSYIGSKDEQIAYFIGAIMGDGCYSINNKYPRPRFIFTSSDKDFILLIQQLAEELFDVDMKINISELSKKNKKWRDSYKVSSRTIYKNLSFYLPNHKILPDFIINGTSEIKAAFISGFFDAEGGVSISWIKSRKAIDRRLHCSNQNLDLLNTITTYLKDMDIKSFIITYPRYYCLNIWGFSSCCLFRQKIGFKIRRKKDKLDELIDTYKVIHIRGNEIIYKLVLDILKDTENIEEIKQKLLIQGYTLDSNTIKKWITKRRMKIMTGRSEDHTVFVGNKPFNRF